MNEDFLNYWGLIFNINIGTKKLNNRDRVLEILKPMYLP